MTELKNIYMPIMEDLTQVEAKIREQLRFLTVGHKFVNEIVSFFFDNPGQKLRPALVILSAKAASASETSEKKPENESPYSEDVIMLATIVEYIHSASLVHDDVVDEDVSRRGKPSMNAQFGNKISVLAGDMLYSHAFALLTDRFDRKIMKILSRCVQRMCRGEINELKECDFEQYLGIISDKTAVFMSACCHSGAALSLKNGNSKEVCALSDFGLNLGMVYQMVDDLKDGDAPIVGAYRGKIVKKLNEFVSNAEKNLSVLRDSVYKEGLANLLRYIVEQHKEIKDPVSCRSVNLGGK
ncbi:MAG: polyprenyl synthetase family protein [Elusimicrobiota bacterium]|nr:polyprenyl synthetase family protein [Elusimicrobiota bacterium]